MSIVGVAVLGVVSLSRGASDAPVARLSVSPAVLAKGSPLPNWLAPRSSGSVFDENNRASIVEVQERRPANVSTANLQLPEPSDEAVAALEQLSQAGDLAGLRELVDRDRSPVRYEALRRLLSLGASLQQLPELFGDDDANLHSLLGSAFGAGGTARDARELASRLRGLEASSAQQAAAGAVLEIDARDPVDEITRASALETLDRLARGADPARAEEACWALTLGSSHGLASLRVIASDRGLDPGVRLAAAEGVGSLDPAQSISLLEGIAADQRGTSVGRYAEALLRRGDL